MIPPTVLITVLIVAPLSGGFLLTRWMREYALRAGQLDQPNARSSHVLPTPRGGGVSFVATTLVATLLLTMIGALSPRTALGLLTGGSLVALVGLIDDRRGLAARWRFLAHLTAIACMLLLVGSWDARLVAPLASTVRAIVLGIALIGGVWLINLTNFMDGIDGIAGTEAVTVCFGIAGCSTLIGAPPDTMLLPLAVAAGALGFLLWNWPPARIFMGDAGSGFLGFSFAALAIDAAQRAPVLFWCWLILLGVFVTDATVTLVRRAARGERITDAHRTHGYQHASRRWGGHRPVTVTVAMINVAWLLPVALLTATGVLAGPVAAVVAYLPLVPLALWAQSGAPELQAAATSPLRPS